MADRGLGPRGWRVGAAALAVVLGALPSGGWAAEAEAPAADPPAEPTAPDDATDDWGDEGGDDGFDAPDDGFDVPDDAFDAPELPGAVGGVARLSPWSLSGFTRSDWAVWSERLGEGAFAQGRQSLDLALRYKKGVFRAVASGHAEIDLAYVVGDDFDAPTRDTYEWLVDLRETYVAASLGDFELTVGRQIVPWGEGDVVSLLDVVNPRDMREPGLADLDDIRLPVAATRLGWFHGPHRVELMVVHEAHFGYRSPPFGPFSPLPGIVRQEMPAAEALLADKTIRYDDVQPAFALEDQQLFARWLYRGEGLDLGLYAASVLDQQGLIRLDPAAFFASDTVAVPLDHRRFAMLGHSGAMPTGDFLLKWELGLDVDRPFTAQSEAGPLALVATEATLVGGLLGVTWAGLSDTQVAVELSKSLRLSSLDDGLSFLFPPDAPTGALRASWQGLRQRLQLGLAATALGLTAEYGFLVRGEGSYTIADGLKATVGYITYQPGDETGPFTGLDRHDRLFARLRWDFVAF